MHWKKVTRRLFIVGFLWLTFQLVVANNSSSHSLSISKEDQFIEELTPYALELSKEYQILPSLMMAQAILESDWGTSELAVVDNNFYGIKGDLNDPLYETLEYNKEWEARKQNFRSYNSLYESMHDYALLLHKGTTWNPNQYRNVLAAKNYKEAAREIQLAGYATDPDYEEKLIEIIETYNLNQYDQK